MEFHAGEPSASRSFRKMLFVELPAGVDSLMIALPSIQALARSNTQSSLEVLTSAECAPLLQGDSLVSKVHIVSVDRSSADVSQQVVIKDIERLVNDGSYDLIVSDARNKEIERVLTSSRARIMKTSDLWLEPFPEQMIEERFLEILARENIIDPHYVSLVGKISLTPLETKWARCWRGNNLLERHPTVILDPNAEKTINAWAAENFINLGRWLVSRHHCNVVILSGDEPDLARVIGREIGKGATILAKCGLRQLAAISSLSSLIISTDAGTARVAAAAGSRAIVLFGPSKARIYGLRPPQVNICTPRACDERNRMDISEGEYVCAQKCALDFQGSCVNDIAPEVVMRAAERLLHS